MSGLLAVGLFLFSIFFTLLIYSLWLRMAMRYFHVSGANPVCVIIYNITNPIVMPLKKFLNYNYAPGARYDWIAFIVLVFIELIKLIIFSFLILGALMPIAYLLIYIIADLIIQPCDLLFYLILIQVILSWIKPDLHHPAMDVMNKITAPILNVFRSLLPEVSGFDFSPFIVLILLKVITLFITFSLPWRIL